MKFNINNYVMVKLTDYGRNELQRQHDELVKTTGYKGAYQPPKTDSDGYSKFQLWDLMATFGHMIFNGCNPPFETEIFIGEKKEI